MSDRCQFRTLAHDDYPGVFCTLSDGHDGQHVVAI